MHTFHPPADRPVDRPVDDAPRPGEPVVSTPTSNGATSNPVTSSPMISSPMISNSGTSHPVINSSAPGPMAAAAADGGTGDGTATRNGTPPRARDAAGSAPAAHTNGHGGHPHANGTAHSNGTAHPNGHDAVRPSMAVGTHGSFPLSGAVDDSDRLVDVVDLLALDPFVTGREPFGRTKYLENVRSDAALTTGDARVVRDAVEEDSHGRLSSGDGWTLHVTRWQQSRRARVTVTATSAELAESVLEAATRNACEEPEPAADSVPIGFWHFGPHGPRRVQREIDAAPWDKIRANYAGPVAQTLERLMAVDGSAVNGRLLLLHGEPGTGKTTALRALAQQWRAWCQVDCVLDPERLFSDPAYLMSVALGSGDEDEPKWRLLMLEDCDELISGEAKASAGQSLSRLLNLTDGLLGQGRNALIAITTNEDLASLHPAVVRPGRCLASIEVGRLSYTEATGWLGTSRGIGPDGATLAELYALKTGAEPVTVPKTPPSTGMYL